MLSDIVTRSPVMNAVILCNGKQNPYTRNDAGYYIFSDLSPSNYEITISANNYVDLKMHVELKPNQTQQFNLDMSYSSVGNLIYNLPRFEFLFKKGKELAVGTEAVITLLNAVESLKIIQTVKKGDQVVTLNISNDKNLTPQRYIYKAVDTGELEKEEKEGKKEESDGEKEGKEITAKLFLLGYDAVLGGYILKEPTNEKLPKNGKFNVYWKLKADDHGKITVPFMERFMKDKELEFEVSFLDKIKKIKINLSDFSEDNSVIQKKIDLL